jgi:hypothetical protein
MEEYNNRQFMIFDVSELNIIDFSQVLETSIDTVRKSIDETKTFVKWDGDITPPCVEMLTTKEGPYTYDEMITILSDETWTLNIEIGWEQLKAGVM